MNNYKWIDTAVYVSSPVVMLLVGILTTSKVGYVSIFFNTVGYGIAPAALAIAPYLAARLVSKQITVALGVYAVGLVAVLATFYAGR